MTVADKTLKRQGEWKINGVTFNDINNRILARPPRGTVELWKLVNKSGAWSHPIHVHLVDFKVVARQGDRPVLPYEAASLQDVVLLGRNEVIFVLARYVPWDGLYVSSSAPLPTHRSHGLITYPQMFHCHNLVHEDHAMMAAFNVTALAGFNYPPQNTQFVDPLDPNFTSRKYDPTVQTIDFVTQNVLPGFAKLGAYDNIEGLESALSSFLATATSFTDTAPVST
jgi:bilirubin oxidase